MYSSLSILVWSKNLLNECVRVSVAMVVLIVLKRKMEWLFSGLGVNCSLHRGLLINNTFILFFFSHSKHWSKNGWSSGLCSYRNSACFMVNVISCSETAVTFHPFSISASKLFSEYNYYQKNLHSTDHRYQSVFLWYKWLWPTNVEKGWNQP